MTSRQIRAEPEPEVVVEEPKPYATILLEFYQNCTLGVQVDGEVTRVNQAALERCVVMAAKKIQIAKRNAFQQLQASKAAAAEHVNG